MRAAFFFFLVSLSPWQANASNRLVVPCSSQESTQRLIQNLRESITREGASLNVPNIQIQAHSGMAEKIIREWQTLCPKKKQFQDLRVVFQNSSRFLNSDSMQTSDSFFQTMENDYQAIETAEKAYSDALKASLQRLKSEYRNFSAQAGLQLSPHLRRNPASRAAVEAAFPKVWGTTLANYNRGIDQITEAHRQGTLSKPIVQISDEIATNTEQLTELRGLRDLNRQKITSMTSLTTTSTTNTETGTAPGHTQPAVQTAAAGAGADQAGASVSDTNVNTGTNTNTNTETGEVPPPTGGNTFQPPPPATTQPPPSTTTTGGGLSQWASDNKGLLIVGGAGAAAVGAAVLYKRNQDKKEKSAMSDMDLQAQVAAGTHNGGGGSAGGGGSSQSGIPSNITEWKGKKLELGAVPTFIKVGEVMAPIELTILDASGNLAEDTGLPVQVKCTKPCSLAGGLTAYSVKGKVVFDNLRFNAADVGIQLRFSASGKDSVVTPGSLTITE